MTSDHLIPLGTGEFSLWRSVCVRSAGLPFEWISDPETIRQAPFLEALAWQHPLVGRLARRAGETMPRDLARTLASYRSRYCAKNDSIGFFGPVAWGAWRDGPTKIGELTPPVRGQLFFEMWAIQALGDALVERYALDEWTVPHRCASVAVTSGGVHLADGSFLPLSEVRQQIVAAADGFHTVADITAACADFGDPEKIVGEVKVLRAMGVLTRGFFIPQSRHPERQLAMQLARVADPDRREAAERDLGALISALDEVRGVLGEPAAVAAELGILHDRFTELAATSWHRRDGEFYAGRSVAYEDCRSEFALELGTELLTEIAPALELMLLSARWYSTQVASRYLALCRDLLASERDPAGYPLPKLLATLASSIGGDAGSPAGQAAAELRRKWTELLSPGRQTGAVTFRSEDIRDEVTAAFAVTEPGWPTARWHGPDLMFAAASVDDLHEGRFLGVLGELHPTINCVDQLCFASTHPDQPALRRWINADMPERIVPLYPMIGGMVNSRTAPPEAYHAPHYTYLGVANEPSYAPRRAKVVAAGGLRVHQEDDRLVVRSVAGDFQADLAEVLDDYLAFAAYNRFGLFEPAAHHPRVQIDRLVVSRERWQLPMAAFPDLPRARLDQVVAHLRRLASEHGLPEVAFWVVAGEAKPIYVDLADPTLVDAVWAKLRRGRQRQPGGWVTVSEMLPGPDELWLRDADGRRYAVEFRVTCVDSRRYGGGNPSV
ncbi:lantibiotic dehydratase [Hamadaea sp. NPDC050747]|uniref:lantibiotic dehydratase n=1 Tax=Hamadaea sp. NPDC050747 TaxID=3155789 RepID=UPI0033C257A3